MGLLRAVGRLGPDLRTLLLGILLAHAGWYVLLPYFAVLFTERRGLTPALAGLVLALQSLALLVGSVAGGVLADRWGRKRTMQAGLVLRVIGLAALGLPGSLGYYLVSSAVAGAGGGLYGPAAKAAIAMVVTPEERETAFSLRGVVANAGISLGPLLGALLVRGPMWVLFGAAAAMHVALAVITQVGLTEPAAERQAPPEPFRDLVTDLPFLAISLASGLSWMLFTQLNIAMPLYARDVLGLEASIGLIWTVISLVVIGLQVPFSRRVLSRIAPLPAMALGSVLLGAGLGLVGPARSLGGVLGASLVFVVGEMFLIPTSDSIVARMARRGAEGAYFGIASLAWGLGESLGNLGGGALMQVALSSRRLALPWTVYAVTGVALGAVWTFLSSWQQPRARLRPTPETEVARVQIFRPGYPTPTEGLPVGGSPPEGPEE